MFDLTAANFLAAMRFDVFTFGRPPVAIDIKTSLKGLDFAATDALASNRQVDGLTVRLIHCPLSQAKAAAGRPRDQNDLDSLPNSA